MSKIIATLQFFYSKELNKEVKNTDPDFIKFKIVEGNVEDVA